MWSCAGINPNARELPVSWQTRTQRVSWAVLVVTCDQYRRSCERVCVRVRARVHLIPVLSPNSVFV